MAVTAILSSTGAYNTGVGIPEGYKATLYIENMAIGIITS